VRYPNVYGIDMPTREELIATGRSNDQIAREICADELIYQDLAALVDDVHQVNPRVVDFEASCFSGCYVTGDVTPEYLADVEAQRRQSDAHTEESGSGQLDLNLALTE
jgi:amidophosphoribosyltransferase